MDNNNVDKQFTPLRNGEVISVNEIGQFLISHSTFRVEEFTSVLKEEIVRNKIGGGDQEKLVWFSEDGLSCEVLRFNSQGWQKGKVRISLEFCPDDSADTVTFSAAEIASAQATMAAIADEGPESLTDEQEEDLEIEELPEPATGGTAASLFDDGDSGNDEEIQDAQSNDDLFGEDGFEEDDLDISFETGSNQGDESILELSDDDGDNMDIDFDTSFDDEDKEDDLDEVFSMEESPVIESSGDLDNLPSDTDFDLGTDIGSVFGDDSLDDGGGDFEDDMVGDVWDDLE